MDEAKRLIIPLCVATVLALLAGLLVLLGAEAEDDQLNCGDGAGSGTGGSVTVADTASHAVGQWSADQVRNAAAIVNAGAALHVPAKGQTVAVMTAIGESTLTVVDHGDTAGPDSRGTVPAALGRLGLLRAADGPGRVRLELLQGAPGHTRLGVDEPHPGRTCGATQRRPQLLHPVLRPGPGPGRGPDSRPCA